MRSHSMKWVLALVLSSFPSLAFASTNSSVLFGEVVDVGNGNKPVADAIIIVTSPALQGEQTAISDENGSYRIDQLPPGEYEVKASAPTFKEFSIQGVKLLVGREIKVRVSMVPEVMEGEEIVVSRITSSIDQGSTTTGITVTKDYMERVTTKRSMEAITEAAPGAQVDDYGISFAGSTSPENNFVVDGLNITNTQYGVNGSNLPLEFFDQIAVNVGGYLPEFGNATGGVITAMTKTGGDEFHGSVFSYTTPLQLARREVRNSTSTITRVLGLDIRQQLGFEFGGPIVKKRLWFHVGFAPTWSNRTAEKRFNVQLDEDGDGIADPDPNDPRLIKTRELRDYRAKYGTFEQLYAFKATLTLAINDNNRVSVGVIGSPSVSAGYNDGFGSTGGALTMTGNESVFLAKNTSGDFSIRANYDGKFLDGKLLVNAVVGYSVTDSNDTPYSAAGNAQRILWAPTLDIVEFEPNLASQCQPLRDADGNVTGPSCPVTGYSTGGVGFLEYNKNERVLGNANVSYLLKALGTHNLKAGLEVQHARTTARSTYTGPDDARTLVRVVDRGGQGNRAQFAYQDYRRYATIPDGATANQITDDQVVQLPYRENSPYFNNIAAYLQESWSIDKINVNLNGGLRFDFQDMYGGVIDPITGQQQRTFALNNLSPRVGLIWDFLGNGRSKIFASYGRFYQLVPLNALVRSVPAEETVTVRRAGPEACTDPIPTNCPAVDATRAASGLSATQIAQDITGQFVDNVQVGAEYQILSDLLVGVNYQHTQYGNVIEDVSLDDTGSYYFLGNPGVPKSPSCVSDPEKEQFCNIDSQDTVDLLTGKTVNIKLPKPERRYDAMNIYVQKSLSRNFTIQASYTLSFLRGNFSGLFRPETSQLNPNINSDFDLSTLLANRYGFLPADRRHQFKLDGAYVWQVTERFGIVPNLVFRVGSGQPYSYNGAHYIYGAGEAYLLSRGTAGVTDPLLQIDFGLKAEYAFTKDTRLTLGLTIINVGNIQLVRDVDQDYALDSSAIRPIAGGDKEDLKYLKDTENNPAVLNANFGNPTRYYAPMEMRIDARLSF